MERTLITGGAGFLGSHLCDFLIEKGHEVICIDNLLTGDMENISHLLGHKRFRFIQYDVTNYLHVDGPLHNILHFASPASPIEYLKMPIQTLKVGSLGTHKALGLAKAKGARFLLASTSECYGDPLIHPQREDYWGNVNPVGPRGVYDEAKRFAEAMTMAYHRYHGVRVRIVRIFNTYGPRMDPNDGRVVSNFIVQALKGEDLTIYGDGTQTRDLLFVEDCVEFILRAGECPEALGQIWNAGTGRDVSINDLAALVSREVGRGTAEIRHVPHHHPQSEIAVLRCDAEKARNLLGWIPRTPLEEGLRRVAAWMRNAGELPAGLQGKS